MMNDHEEGGGAAMDTKGFLGELFDFSFSKFVTFRVVKVLYGLGIAGAVIFGLSVLVRGFMLLRYQALVGLVTILIGAPLAMFLTILWARIWLEIIIVIFRIAENTGQLVEQGKTTPPTEPGSVQP